MFIKQLSVFIENRKGRLEKVTGALRANDINIVSLSLADTNEYGLLRMVVSDPDKAKAVLRENGFSAMLTDVIAVKLPNQLGMLQDLLKLLSDAELNIEYMYVLATGTGISSMIIKTNDPQKAVEALEAGNMEVFDPQEAYNI